MDETTEMQHQHRLQQQSPLQDDFPRSTMNFFPLFGNLNSSSAFAPKANDSPLYEGPDDLAADSFIRPAPPLFQPPPPVRHTNDGESATTITSASSSTNSLLSTTVKQPSNPSNRNKSERPVSPSLSHKTAAPAAASRRRSSSSQLFSSVIDDKRTRNANTGMEEPDDMVIDRDIIDETASSPVPSPEGKNEDEVRSGSVMLQSSAQNTVAAIEEKRKRNPAYLNSRPRFYELNNDALLSDVWNALIRGQTNWLAAKEIQTLLDFCKLMKMGARAPTRPPSGTIYYFDARAGEYFRRDGYDYIKKKGSGKSVREDHVKLRQGAVAIIYASYVHSAEWVDGSGASLFHRRSYWLVDSDEKDRGVIVHYLGNLESDIDPVTRPHDPQCECILCCLKRENSRPDRPGESLEQILSRAEMLANLEKKARGASNKRDKMTSSVIEGSTRQRRGSVSGNSNNRLHDEDDELTQQPDDLGDEEDPSREDEDETTMDMDDRTASQLEEAVLSSTTFAQQQQDEQQMRRRPNPLVVPPSHPSNQQGNMNQQHYQNLSIVLDPLSPSESANHAHSEMDMEFDMEHLSSLLTPVHTNSIHRRISHDLDNLHAHMLSSDSPSHFHSHAQAQMQLLQGNEKNSMMVPPGPPTNVASASAPSRPESSVWNDKSKKSPRFDAANLTVVAFAPERLREGTTCLIVMGMRFAPETLNYRTWIGKIFPKLQIWFGEYRVLALECVALGVVRFVCPPRFRAASSTASNAVQASEGEEVSFEIRLEGREAPLPLMFMPKPKWEAPVGQSLPSLKRARPSFTPSKSHPSGDDHPPSPASHNNNDRASEQVLRDADGVEQPVKSPFYLAKRRLSSTLPSSLGRAGGDNEDEQEEEEEEEDLDRKATMMIDRVVKLMTSHGVSSDATPIAEMINEVSEENGFNFLHTAVFCSASVDVISTLLAHGADPNVKTRTSERNSALHFACEQGNVEVARALIKSGADPSYVNAQGLTPVEMILSREESETDEELFALLGYNPSTSSDQMQHQDVTVSPFRGLKVGSPRLLTPLRSSSSASNTGFSLLPPQTSTAPSMSASGVLANPTFGAASGEMESSGSHIALLREALSTLSLKEQYALAVAVSSDSNEKKGRRTTSLASLSEVPMNLTSSERTEHLPLPPASAMGVPGAQPSDADDEDDDVTRVVAETQGTVLAALGQMNSTEKELLDADARKIQANVRAWILRRQFKEVREAARKVQAFAKGHLARRHFRELREKASATLVIQKSLRAHIKAKRARQQQLHHGSPSANSFSSHQQAVSPHLLAASSMVTPNLAPSAGFPPPPSSGFQIGPSASFDTPRINSILGSSSSGGEFTFSLAPVAADTANRMSHPPAMANMNTTNNTAGGNTREGDVHPADACILSTDDPFDVHMKEEDD